jgi:hypothetical protein
LSITAGTYASRQLSKDGRLASAAPPGDIGALEDPAGLRQILRRAGDHMVCHYDLATADVLGWDPTLRQALGEDLAALVRYRPARTLPAELVTLLGRVVGRDWHPRAAATALTTGIDWEREIIEVALAAPASDTVTLALVALVGDRAVITTGATTSRG